METLCWDRDRPCPGQGGPGESAPLSVGTSVPGVPSAEPWDRELSWPSVSCPRQALSGSSVTAGTVLPSLQTVLAVPVIVVSVSRGALVPSAACSGGDRCTGWFTAQDSLLGTPAPLGSPDASQVGDGPGHCAPQAGLCKGSPPKDSPAGSTPWALAGTPVARSIPQVTSCAAAMVSTESALWGWGSGEPGSTAPAQATRAIGREAAVPLATHCPGRGTVACLAVPSRVALGSVPSCPLPLWPYSKSSLSQCPLVFPIPVSSVWVVLGA